MLSCTLHGDTTLDAENSFFFLLASLIWEAVGTLSSPALASTQCLKEDVSGIAANSILFGIDKMAV